MICFGHWAAGDALHGDRKQQEGQVSIRSGDGDELYLGHEESPGEGAPEQRGCQALR